MSRQESPTVDRVAAALGDEPPTHRRIFAALLGVTVLRDLLTVNVPLAILQPPDTFRLPWFDLLPILPRTPLTEAAAHGALGIMALAAAWMVLRPAGPWAPLALLAGYGAAFFVDQRSYTSNQYLLLLCLGLVAAWSGRAPAAAWPRLALRLLFTSVYVAAVAAKIDAAWLDGLIVREALLHYGTMWGPMGLDDALGAGHPIYVATAGLTLALEAFLVVGLWVPRLRVAAVALGVALHVGIEALMPVRCFSYLMIAGYVLYADRPPAPRAEPAWRWLAGGVAFAVAVAGGFRAAGIYPLPPTNLLAVGAGVSLAVLLCRRAVLEQPAHPARRGLRAAILTTLAIAHAALLIKPLVGGGDRFGFRMFRQIVVVQAETRARVGDRWRTYPMLGATDYWFPTAAAYYWESWDEHQVFLQGYADWILPVSGAEDARVVARFRVNDGPVRQAAYAPGGGPP